VGDTRKSVVIVGGGASGVLLAAHLLRAARPGVRVTLIERRGAVGQGVAYSAHQQDHLLNVAAPGMSAFADDPEHFWRWLRGRGLVDEGHRFVFVPRRHYGAYLSDVLAEASAGGQLVLVNGTAIDLTTSQAGIEVVLDTAERIAGDVAVLAVGHEENPARSRGIAVRVGSDRDTPLEADAAVMILGSGLSMVDAWLTLAQAGHRGSITVVSRHGLLPEEHRLAPRLELAAGEVPIGRDARGFERWFRTRIERHLRDGGDWRSVVDALRPYNQRIWQGWDEPSRRAFLEHLRPFWNIHRHRLPPDLHARMIETIERGQMRLIAGKMIGLAHAGDDVRATVRRRGAPDSETLSVARVYDCGGVTVDVEQSSNPLIQALLSRGSARADNLHTGLDVTTGTQVMAADGTPSQRLYALGPLTRGTFFEIEAIPDIRVQAAGLAKALLSAC